MKNYKYNTILLSALAPIVFIIYTCICSGVVAYIGFQFIHMLVGEYNGLLLYWVLFIPIFVAQGTVTFAVFNSKNFGKGRAVGSISKDYIIKLMSQSIIFGAILLFMFSGIYENWYGNVPLLDILDPEGYFIPVYPSIMIAISYVLCKLLFDKSIRNN